MHATVDHQPVVERLEDFDTRSGNLAERVLFNNRLLIVILCIVGTLLLGWQATRIQLNASFEKMIPTAHPYIANFLANRGDLPALGNSIRIAVETTDGTIFDKEYLDTLQKMNDEIYLLPGVDRPFMKSLWTTGTRWAAVTEEGLEGGTVMPDGFDGSAQSLEQVRANVERSGEIGQLVAANFKSSVIFIPLIDQNHLTGEKLDYRKLNASIEQIRAKFQKGKIRIHVTGFAKVIGDLIDGLVQVLGFFAAAIVIATAMLYWYTRCARSTLLVVACSLIAVIWQFGIVSLFGYTLDPYSVLVPFLVFAIGMSHGAQKMNGIMQDVGRGTHRVVAARYTFRRLFVAGLTALLCDAVGFGVLMIIDIQVIKDLAVIASIGVAVLIFTNLILLPILLSYVGVSPAAAERSLKAEQLDENGAKHWVWEFLDLFTQRRWATISVILGAVMAIVGYAISTQLQVGDLDPGAPELRADSRYNRDNAFMVENFAASSDILVVMVKTPDDQCTRYATLSKVDQLGWELEQVPGVEATNSMANLSRISSAGYNEGNFKWFELIPNEDVLGGVQNRAPRELFNQACNLLTLYVYLKDHKAETLTRVIDKVEAYAAANNTPETKFVLAAGSAGIEAATNIVVKKATHDMMLWVYGAVILLCWATFRNWRAVAAAVLPLVLTSILCEALMVIFGMGVKVATLPVIALGVGIGVDYALYVLSVMLTRMREGMSLSEAYYRALLFTGKVVMLTGVTLAIGVATWALSPIKFQADMGILLAFMFIWNMLGALLLLPALAYFLLPQPATDDGSKGTDNVLGDASHQASSNKRTDLRTQMNWKTRLHAKAMRFFFNRIVMRKPAYQIDGVPASTNDEVLEIPTPQGTARTLLHRPPNARAGDRLRPAVVLFHGGGFVFGLPEHEAAFCRRIANNLDCIVINPDYVLSPEYPFPHAAHQCYEIAAWVAREAEKLGIDPQRIAVGGHSAGGNLATVVTAQAVAKGFPKFCYQILDYPFLDATVAPEQKRSPIDNPLIAPGLATLFNSCYMPPGTNLRDPLLSPVYADKAALSGHPPTLVITAEYDTLRPEADKYADMLREAGVAVRHVVFPGVDHAFTHNGPKEPADAAWRLMEECLRGAFSTVSNTASTNAVSA